MKFIVMQCWIDAEGNITKDIERDYIGPEFWNGEYFDGSPM